MMTRLFNDRQGPDMQNAPFWAQQTSVRKIGSISCVCIYNDHSKLLNMMKMEGLVCRDPFQVEI